MKLKRFKEYNKVHHLSGIILLVNGKILLVHSKKHKAANKMWSVPKGHIEGGTLKSALTELKEETGIKIKSDFDLKFKVKYITNSKKKVLTLYLFTKELSELSKYITDSFKLKKRTLKKVDSEIHDVKFFTLEEARKFLQPGQRQIIDIIK